MQVVLTADANSCEVHLTVLQASRGATQGTLGQAAKRRSGHLISENTLVASKNEGSKMEGVLPDGRTDLCCRR